MKSVADIFRSYAVLDGDGRHVNGTDKESNHHYGAAYEALLVGRRNEVELVMEVGVADGSCLLAWCEVFPNALIVGMDIHSSDRAHGDCIEFHLGDQRVQRDCEAAAAGRQFDMIIDDATHYIENTLLTLYYLWPSVKPGGIYVVEEWPGTDLKHVQSLWPQAEIVNTLGPFGGVEPLVVMRKSE